MVTRASPISRKRVLTSRSRQRASNVRTTRGVSFGSLPTSIGARSTSASVWATVSPPNRRWPLSISNKTTPKLQMSARLSTGRPDACSGLMYAAVPRIIPACVIAGVVIVGDCDTTLACADCARRRLHRLRQPEVEHLHRAVAAHLDVRGLQIAMDDALLVRRFERLGNLLRDRERLIERDRTSSDALREIVSLDQFHHEGGHAPALFEAVDGGDVWVVQRGEGLGFTLEAREPISIVGERLGQHLDRDVAIQFRIAGAKYLPHSPFPDAGDHFVDAEANAGGEGQVWRHYTGERGRERDRSRKTSSPWVRPHQFRPWQGLVTRCSSNSPRPHPISLNVAHAR